MSARSRAWPWFLGWCWRGHQATLSQEMERQRQADRLADEMMGIVALDESLRPLQRSLLREPWVFHVVWRPKL